MTFFFYAILGACAGTLAGLFGIGGGLIIVPTLIFSFEVQGIAPEILTHLAVGTSLATIIVTSISSIQTHHKKGAVHWQTFFYLSLGIVVGSWLGVSTAVNLSSSTLQSILGIFVLFVAIKMWFGFKPTLSNKPCSNPLIIGTGSIIGWISSIFGIGGGTLTVPFLRRNRFPINQAIGTSAACGLPIAIVGASTNIVMGLSHPLLPEFATGFVYWPAFLGIILTSTLFARVGAKLAHQLPAEKLQKSFAIFLLFISIKFLWPI